MASSTSKSHSLLLAFPGFEKDLREELRRLGAPIDHEDERFFLVSDLEQRPVWAQVCAHGGSLHSVSSITHAAKLLKSMGRKWACVSPQLHRRSELIQEKLGSDKPLKLDFLKPKAPVTWGLWALLGTDKLVAAPASDSPVPAGDVQFHESKTPPSRAYLKLWETFTLHAPPPSPAEVVADFGSSPGGWTWVLAQLAKSVFSIDKAPLAPSVAAATNVVSVKKDAFKLNPEDLGPIDWFFSDIICEPPRLLDLVERWRAAGVKKFVCTIKFKGHTDFETMERFLAIPESRVIHLCSNKHEVTWLCGVPNLMIGASKP